MNFSVTRYFDSLHEGASVTIDLLAAEMLEVGLNPEERDALLALASANKSHDLETQRAAMAGVVNALMSIRRGILEEMEKAEVPDTEVITPRRRVRIRKPPPQTPQEG